MRFILPLTMIVVTLLAGCQQAEPEAVNTAVVEANAAYRQHFGPPPEVRSGRAFARVGYLPLKSEPQQVAALPLFLYSEQEQIQLVLDRVVSGAMSRSGDARYLTPFAGKVAISKVQRQGSTLQVALQRLVKEPLSEPQALARALTATSCQFDDVKQVQLLVAGEPFPGQPEAGFACQAQLIAPVAKPELVLVAGVWEADSSAPEELMISFDRPVSINSFRVLDERGEQVGGNYFSSMFNMAVVIHPQRPEDFTPGTLLNVVWDVTDQLGRSNSGFSKLALQRFEHP